MCIKLRKSKKKIKKNLRSKNNFKHDKSIEKKDVRVKPNQTFGKNPKSFQISNYLNEMVSADSL